jgi:hypothetical protein
MRHLPRRILVLVAGALLALSILGASAAAAAALPIQDRLVTTKDLPGYPPNGRPRPIRDAYAWALIVLGDMNADRATRLLTDSGFVAAAIERFRAPVGSYGDATVTQGGSAEQARRALVRVHLMSFAPCPTNCGIKRRRLAVPGIPGARGTVVSGRQSNGRPFRDYLVFFADGPYLYTLTLGGDRGRITQGQVLAAARSWYGRVRGAEAP